MTSTWVKNEWTAFTEEDLLNAGSDNGSSIGSGDTFTMPGTASVTMSTWDNDSSLSGDNWNNEHANDGSGQNAVVDGARVGSQMYAEKYHVLHGSDGKTYYLIEIEVEGYNAPGTGDDYFTFYGQVPPAGVELTVVQSCNVTGCWVDYKCLGAGDTAPPNTPPHFTNLPYDGIICVDENTTFVIDSDATDADGDALTYEIVGGRDAAFFEIDAHTGELTFVGAPDYENPQSGGDNNTYDVTIKVSDDKGGSDTKALWVKVKDVDEPQPECIVIEAEDMHKWGFRTVHGDQASGGELVKLECAGGQGDLSTTFTGESGEYDLTIHAQDENDGQSTLMVKVNDVVVGTIHLDRDSDGGGSNHGGFSAFTLENIQINAGDKVSIWADGEHGEYVRIDKIELCKDGETCPEGFTLQDFSGAGTGAIVSTQFDGFTVEAQRAGDGDGSPNDAMIFDTANPTGGDHDLATSTLGNVIIISEDGDGSDPDDNAGGGTITFTFDNPSDVHDIKVLDIENPGSTIELFDADGVLIKSVDIPGAGDNSIQTVLLDAQDVSSMVVTLTTSGAVDDLCFKPGEAVECVEVLENSSAPVIDLDCGTGENLDVGVDICATIHADMNDFGEDAEKPSSITLTLGDELTSEINSTQGDKLEVGDVMTGDDGDGTYFIRVSDDGDATKTDTLYFSGDVDAGQSFTANGIDGKFGSETFVHIFSSDGGTLLQTINFHTSCSAPLVIGDQYGSVSLEGAAVVGKDTGTVYQIGSTEGPGDEGVTYTLKDGGPTDADGNPLFEVNEDGEVSFITPPDFEDPQGIDGTNNYEVTVVCTLDDGTVEEKRIEICVEDDCIKITENSKTIIIDLDCGTGENLDVGVDICAAIHADMNDFGEDAEKPSSITLTLGDELTSEINSTQGDKLEVGDVMTGDDGDGTYFIRVSDDGDATKTDTLYFSGDVDAGQSFTANGIDGKFGSETFVHIFSSDGGTLLQTINFHTSCSAPLVIGDQYGSVSLEGAAVVGKDTGTVYQIGSTEGPGDEGVTYTLKDGGPTDADGNPLFEVNEDGEVSFITPPDFEDPQGIDGTNNYEVTVVCTLDDGTVEEKRIEICVEDQDCITIRENTDPGVIADLDCEENEENPDLGLEICAEIDRQKDNGVELEKPSELTLTLGDVIGTDPSGFQPDGKSSVTTVGTEDGDGAIRVLVSDDDDPTKTDTVYFEGDLSLGDTFTALASNAGDSAFASNTYIHLFDDDGSVIQTIQVHTSCSAPIVIGDTIGTVTLTGVGLPVKDTAEVVRYGGSVTREVIYEITGGDGFDSASGTSPFFNVDPQTGEVTLAFDPDFENPLDDNGDNSYVVEVSGYFVNSDGTREVCEVKPIEICIEDVDEPGSLSGRYFIDANNNAVDDSEPGVEGVLVELLNADGTGTGITTTTGPDGSYSFGNLTAGTYGVKFTDAVSGLTLVTPNQGGDETIDSDAIDIGGGMSTISDITVVAGADTPDNDAGVEDAGTASVGDFAFLDANGNGLQDLGEAGIEGINVTLTGAGADGAFDTGDDTTATTTTAADGKYLFDGLKAGDYKVTFDTATTAGLILTAASAAAADAAGDDSDADQTNGMTDVFTLSVGEAELDIDAGYVDPNTAVIRGRVFCDDNNNDVDDSEPGVAGVTVTLSNGDTAVTDADGNYEFTGLSAGDYTVTFPSSVDGKTLVDPNAGPDDIDSDAVDNNDGTATTGTIVLGIGEVSEDNDAGIEDPGTASIGDKVFLDANGNGQQDLGEVGVDGVGVTLLDENGVAIATTTTLNGGMYLFDNLAAGDYSIEFDAVDTFVFTDQDQGNDATDSDADVVTGRTGTYTLAIGEANLTVDAGLVAANNNPDPADDEGMVCADELLTLDVLANDGTLVGTDIVDADGDVLTITKVDGQDIVDGGDAIQTSAGTFVTLVDGELVFNGEAAYASLDILESALETISYTVDDGNGGTADANIAVTFKGDANSYQSFSDSLPAQTTFTVSGALDDPDAFDVVLNGTGDARFDGMTFEAAYCLAFRDPIPLGTDVTADVIGAEAGPEAEAVFSLDQISGFNGLSAAENLDLVKYIVAQDYESDVGIDGWDVQLAIWELTNNLTDRERDFYPEADEAVVQTILADAAANGEGFEFGASGTVGAIINPNPQVQGEIEQPFIFGFNLEDYDCIC